MGLFRYEAVDKTGKIVRGVMNAPDDQQVARNLAGMGYSVRSVYGQSPASSGRQAVPVPATATGVGPRRSTGMSAVTIASGVPVSISSRVPISQLAVYFRHLATLIKSGIPVSQALTEMAMVTRNPVLKKTIPTLQEASRGGRGLSGTMAEFPDVFPVHTIASVWAGELAGKLDTTLLELASDLEQEASDTRYARFGWIITKIHIIGFAVLLPMCNFVPLLMPVLEESLKKQGNMSTGEVLSLVLSSYLKTMFWQSMAICAAICALWVVWGFMKRVPVVRRLIDGALLWTPLWGRLHREKAMARFFHVMDDLYSSGIAPGQAWDAASLTVRNSCDR